MATVFGWAWTISDSCCVPTVVVANDDDWGETLALYWDDEEWNLLLDE